MKKIFFIIILISFSSPSFSGWAFTDHLYGFFVENYDFTSSCHRNRYDYDFDASSNPTKMPEICYPNYFPKFTEQKELLDVYDELEQWLWISESIKEKLPLLRDSEVFYKQKITQIGKSNDILADDYVSKLTDNIKLHGTLNRTINELDILLRACPDSEVERKKELLTRKQSALQAIDLIVRETPIITNEVFKPYIDNEKNRRRNNFSSLAFKNDLISSFKEAHSLTTERRKSYTKILGTGIRRGEDVQQSRGANAVVDYKEFVKDVVGDKDLILELLATSSPENRPGLERLRTAKCELQAKAWQTEANQTKQTFYIQSAITVMSVGLSSVYAPTTAATVAGANNLKNLAIGLEAWFMGMDLMFLGAEYLDKQDQCLVHKNNLFLEGASSSEYLKCLEELRDIQINSLVAVATGGISVGLVSKTSNATVRSLELAAEEARSFRAAQSISPPREEVAVEIIGDVSDLPSSTVHLRAGPVHPDLIRVGTTLDFYAQTYVVKKALKSPIKGKSGLIYNGHIAVKGNPPRQRLILIGASEEGGAISQMSSINYRVQVDHKTKRNVLDILMAETGEEYRGRGALGQLYEYIYEVANDPPITAKKSLFIGTNQLLFTESLIKQINPEYLAKNPIKSGLNEFAYEDAMEAAFVKCCSEDFMELQKKSPKEYDRMVQEAFENTPSGRQTKDRFPNLCSNEVEFSTQLNELSVEMVHCH